MNGTSAADRCNYQVDRVNVICLMPSVNEALIGGPSYLLSSKDDKIMQFYIISVSFFHVFIVNN